MGPSSRIPGLIHSTLCAVALAELGCGPELADESAEDDVSDYDDCGPSDPVPFSVDAWNLDADGYALIVAQAQEHGSPWPEMTDATRCHVACAYADGRLMEWFTPYYGGYGYVTVEHDSCVLTIDVEGDVFLDATVSCTGNTIQTPGCLGRRPLEFDERGLASDDRLSGFARLEHASIEAFEELAEQLVALAAPAELIARCRSAARDEARHVDLWVGIGAERPEQSGRVPRVASRLAIALHNASEGCAMETWAALVAAHQAEHAEGEAERRAFAEIADDEARHAELAWDLHDWMCTTLSPEERRLVERARVDALARLAKVALEQAIAVEAELRARLGLPEPKRAQRLARDFARRLLAARGPDRLNAASTGT